MLNNLAITGFALGGLVSILVVQNGYCLLTGFVGLGQAEARFIKIKCSYGVLR